MPSFTSVRKSSATTCFQPGRSPTGIATPDGPAVPDLLAATVKDLDAPTCDHVPPTWRQVK